MALGALLLFAACPFTPREPPRPCTPGVDPGCRTPVPFQDPLTPEIVRENIKNALRKRGFDGPNLFPNYVQSLDVAFVFEPDLLAGSTPRTCPGGVPFFANYGQEREVHFMQELLEGAAPPDSAEISFPVWEVDTGSGITDPDRRRYNVEYVLTLRGVRVGTDRQTRCYGARAKWDLIGGNRNFWTLLAWRDIEPLDSSTACPGGALAGTMGNLKLDVGNCE